LRLVVFVDNDRANLPIAWIPAEAGLRGKGRKNEVAFEDDRRLRFQVILDDGFKRGRHDTADINHVFGNLIGR
jgi:hypothetical protein